MLDLILMLFNSLLLGLRARSVLQAEIIALRHQLIVLQRNQKPKRLVLNRGDRCLWVWLSRVWSGWRSSLIIVKPETVIGWHRRGFRWYWTWKIRHGRCRTTLQTASRPLTRMVPDSGRNFFIRITSQDKTPHGMMPLGRMS